MWRSPSDSTIHLPTGFDWWWVGQTHLEMPACTIHPKSQPFECMAPSRQHEQTEQPVPVRPLAACKWQRNQERMLSATAILWEIKSHYRFISWLTTSQFKPSTNFSLCLRLSEGGKVASAAVNRVADCWTSRSGLSRSDKWPEGPFW
jgi:hypothetical protein